MTRTQKLRVMELIWADLSGHPDEIDSPAWHQDALFESQRAYEKGETTFADWDEAKQRIRRQTTGHA